jgi:cytochrome b561
MAIVADLSFREKSIFVSLLAVLLVYGCYFTELLASSQQYTLSAMLHTSIGVVVTLVVIEVLLHAVLASIDRSAEVPEDERDRAIRTRAASLAYSVLSAGVILVLLHVLVRGAMDSGFAATEFSLFVIANLLLFVIVFSEVVHYGAQLWLYRRGV